MEENESVTQQLDPIERMRAMLEEQADEALSQNDLGNYDFLIDQLNRLPAQNEPSEPTGN